MSETRMGQTVADWQPIETAPKDTEVLIATEDGLTGEAVFWDTCQEDSGWYWGDNDPVDMWEYGGRIENAVAWAYLPPPPEVR